MCGIAGLVRVGSKGGDVEQIVQEMIGELTHRGPDMEGLWSDGTAELCLGHRRLSIIDLSLAGHQPMHSHDQRYVISFNGEIYNFRELRTELTLDGVAFRGDSDTEVLLELIARQGLPTAVNRIRGMYALALWDNRDRRLYLVRDIAGEKPLYYGKCGPYFCFASELRAFKKIPGFDSQVDVNSLASLLEYNYIPSPHSIYKDIHKLPKASILTYSPRDDALSIAPYWELGQHGHGRLDGATPAELLDRFEELLRTSIKRQMIADVPLGAFLSGGIDSSTIVAVMQSLADEPVKTFTIGFNDERWDEAIFAKKVAEHLETDHTELYIDPLSLIDLVAEMPAVYDEPMGDVSQIPTTVVAKLARRDVVVSLSGDAGDELFSGYTWYDRSARLWSMIRNIPAGLRAGGAAALSIPGLDLAANRALRLGLSTFGSGGGGQAFTKAQRFADLFGQREFSGFYKAIQRQGFRADQFVDLETPREGLEFQSCVAEDKHEFMRHFDFESFLSDDILVKLDRAAMAVSLETRIPLLDRDVIEFAFGIPTEIHRFDGKGKWFLRQLLGKHVPTRLFDRPKRGFSVPISTWLEGPLRPWVADMLSERRLKEIPYLKQAAITRALDEHLQGRFDWGRELWNLLSFLNWRDHG